MANECVDPQMVDGSPTFQMPTAMTDDGGGDRQTVGRMYVPSRSDSARTLARPLQLDPL